MGWIKDLKGHLVAEEAARAVREGRTVFAAMLNTPKSQPDLSGSISGWAEMIEAIEAEGWVLSHWNVGADAKGRPQAYPLFRRSSQPASETL